MGNESSVTEGGEEVSLEEHISTLQEKHAKLEQALAEENRHQKLAIKDEITKLGGR
jgi:uncharacterized protein YdcH (DUF465 family)